MRVKDELLENLSWNRMHRQQSVVILLVFPRGTLQERNALHAVVELERVFKEIIDQTGVGEFDRNELYEGQEEEYVTFYIFGRDADAIYDVVSPVIAYLPKFVNVSIARYYSSELSNNQYMNTKMVE